MSCYSIARSYSDTLLNRKPDLAELATKTATLLKPKSVIARPAAQNLKDQKLVLHVQVETIQRVELKQNR